MIALLLAALVPAAAAWTIDLAAAMEIVLRDGVDAREAALAERAAEAALASRRAAGLPDLRLGASTAVGLDATGPEASARLSLTSITPLYAGGSLTADREAAEAAVRAARADAEAVRQDLHLALAGALLTLREAEAQAASARSALAAEQALAERVAALVAAGARTRADALQEAAAVARARALEVGTARDAEQAALALRRLLRLAPDAAVTFVPPDPPVFASDPAALAALAAERRPELVALRAARAEAEAEARGAGAGGRPSLDLVLGADTSLAASGGPAGEQLRDGAGASAALQLAVPLFDRGATRERVALAGVAEQRAALALRTAEEDVAYDLRGALLDTEAAAATLAAAHEREVAAGAAATVVQDRYEAGAATFAELQAIRAEALAAAAAAVAAEADAARARFGLVRAYGGL